MQIFIKPNWSTGNLTQIQGDFTPFRRIRPTVFRFYSSVDISVNTALLIVQRNTESRSRVSESSPGGPLGFIITVTILSGQYNLTEITAVYQIEENVSYLLEGAIDFRLNLSVFSIEEGLKASDYTRTFQIPFTKKNNQIFTQLFNVNVDSGYNPRLRSDATIVTAGGGLLSEGYIQLLEVNPFEQTYNCVFYGQNSSFFKAIADDFIFGNDDETKDIRFDDLVHNVSDTEVFAGWNNERDYLYGILQDENNNFIRSYMFKGVEPWRYKMYMKSKAIWDRIFSKHGFTYESEFLETSDLFSKHVTLPANGFTIGQPIIKWGNETPVTYNLPNVGFSGISLDTEQFSFFGGGYNTTTRRFQVPEKGQYTFSAQINLAVSPNLGPLPSGNVIDQLRIQWVVYRNGQAIVTRNGAIQPFVAASAGLRATVPLNSKLSYKDVEILPQLLKDDEIEFRIFTETFNNYSVTGVNQDNGGAFPNEPFDFISINSSKIGVSPGPLFGGIKQSDFIGDIFKQFNLYLKPDKTNPRHFLIEPRDDFYRKGKVIDFLDYDRDSVQLSYGNDILPKSWTFTYKPGDDEDNTLWQTQFPNRVFGDAKINLPENLLLQGERKIELSAMPIIYEKVFDNFVLPSLTNGTKTGQLRYSLYSGLETFNGVFKLPLGATAPMETTWNFPIQDSPPTRTNFYPLFSNYSDGLGIGDTILFATENKSKGKESSLFFNFWSSEVETYSDPNTHILTLDLYLTPAILSKIDYNDRYWFEIKGVGRYYTLLEIREFNPEEPGLFTAKFLPYLDYRAERPKRGRDFDGTVDINTPSPDEIIDNIFPIRKPGDSDIVDDNWGNEPNEAINGGVTRGTGIVYLGDAKYPTLIGDGIIVEGGTERVFVGGNGISIGATATDSFVWGAQNTGVNAKVVSFGATGKSHDIDNSFLFNDFNPVLDGRDQTTITVAEEGTLVWNPTEENLYIRKSPNWVSIANAPGYLTLYDISSASDTTFPAPPSWQVLVLSETIAFQTANWTTNGTGLITYTGAAPHVFKVEGILSGSSANNNEIHISLWKNGSIIAQSEQSSVTDAAGRKGQTIFQTFVDLSNGDQIQVYIMNSTGPNDFTLDKFNLIVLKVS